MSSEESAALACQAALTEWFATDGECDLNQFLAGEKPAHVVEFLFAQTVACIRNHAEATGMSPEQYLQIIGVQIAEDVYNSQ